jgi:hypothetical protein
MEISPIKEGVYFFLQLKDQEEALYKKSKHPLEERPLYLPLSKTAEMEDAEKVYWICHLCGKFIRSDTSKRITTGRVDVGTKITIEHALCKTCKKEYYGH